LTETHDGTIPLTDIVYEYYSNGEAELNITKNDDETILSTNLDYELLPTTDVGFYTDVDELPTTFQVGGQWWDMNNIPDHEGVEWSWHIPENPDMIGTDYLMKRDGFNIMVETAKPQNTIEWNDFFPAGYTGDRGTCDYCIQDVYVNGGTPPTEDPECEVDGGTESGYGTDAPADGGIVPGPPITEPTVTTQAVTNITSDSATGNGNITSLGIPIPTEHGICWNQDFPFNPGGNPTIADNVTAEGTASTTGAYTTQITGLVDLTTYYVRAYATNSVNTVYGEEVTFTTLEEPSVGDDCESEYDEGYSDGELAAENMEGGTLEWNPYEGEECEEMYLQGWEDGYNDYEPEE